jgi:hypothetical protein
VKNDENNLQIHNYVAFASVPNEDWSKIQAQRELPKALDSFASVPDSNSQSSCYVLKT